MDSYDYFNQLSGKVNELKHKKNAIVQDVARDRDQKTKLESEIRKLENDLQKATNDYNTKQQQLHQFDNLI